MYTDTLKKQIHSLKKDTTIGPKKKFDEKIFALHVHGKEYSQNRYIHVHTCMFVGDWQSDNFNNQFTRDRVCLNRATLAQKYVYLKH